MQFGFLPLFVGAPAADFYRMVWGARIAGVFFLADDYIDSGKMLDRIPGFKMVSYSLLLRCWNAITWPGRRRCF